MTIEASINSMLIADDSALFYDEKFRMVVEDHMTYLRTHPNTTMVTVTPMQAYKYEFDMIGLLSSLGIPLKLHWVIIRMNHLSSLTHVPKDLTQILIPPDRVFGQIRQTHEASLKAVS